MKRRAVVLGLGTIVGQLLLAGAAAAAPTVYSGPQVDSKVPGPFHPLNVTGPDAGKKTCLYCENGPRPVAMIFAREISPAVVALIKKIDAATAAHTDCRMGSFIVFCNEAEGLPKQLAELARKENLKNIILSTFAVGGPANYHLAPEADVTVVLYTHFTVKANHAFSKGEMSSKDIDKIIADVAKILPQD
jgi:hypothetical protein